MLLLHKLVEIANDPTADDHRRIKADQPVGLWLRQSLGIRPRLSVSAANLSDWVGDVPLDGLLSCFRIDTQVDDRTRFRRPDTVGLTALYSEAGGRTANERYEATGLLYVPGPWLVPTGLTYKPGGLDSDSAEYLNLLAYLWLDSAPPPLYGKEQRER